MLVVLIIATLNILALLYRKICSAAYLLLVAHASVDPKKLVLADDCCCTYIVILFR
jgi:hypothetical protein